MLRVRYNSYAVHCTYVVRCSSYILQRKSYIYIVRHKVLAAYILHRTSCTVRIASYVLHRTSCIICFAAYVLQQRSCSIRLASYVLHHTSCSIRLAAKVLQHTTCTVRLASYVLHLTYCIVRLTSNVLHRTSYIVCLEAKVLHRTSYIIRIIWRSPYSISYIPHYTLSRAMYCIFAYPHEVYLFDIMVYDYRRTRDHTHELVDLRLTRRAITSLDCLYPTHRVIPKSLQQVRYIYIYIYCIVEE